MLLHPEVQRKAQEEIDRVIGNDRFPTLADQPNLPYVGAVAKEVLRWAPVAPLCKFTFFETEKRCFPSLWARLTT